MRTALYWVAVLFIVIVVRSIGSAHAIGLIHPRAFLIVAGPVLVIVLCGTGLRGFFPYWKRLVIGEPNSEDTALTQKAATLGFFAGGIGLTIGALQIIENLSDWQELGSGIRFSVMTLLYALTQGALLVPAARSANYANTV